MAHSEMCTQRKHFCIAENTHLARFSAARHGESAKGRLVGGGSFGINSSLMIDSTKIIFL